MSQRKRSKGLGYSQMTDGEDDSIPTQVERRSQDQVNQKVSELVQFLLVKDQKKIPIKRADMLKNIIREYRDAYTEIVRRADRTLQEVFGLQLVEIDTKRHIYILINNLPRAEGEHLCRCSVGIPAPAPCVPREAAQRVRRRPQAGDRGVCAAEVPGDHPHPPDGPPRVQIPVGAPGRKGNLQEGRAQLRGQDAGQGPHVLGEPVQRGRGQQSHHLTPPQNKGTPLACSPPISRLSAWL
ncbi:uncharacterized protein LOC120503071 isoform X2 [Passer montanus]|uniref:uncharacterized protein LOC120503071 isoform X2 n=1 Tax=Passer montanus TaxID=9160 RepID=UPI001960BAF1|nr:uncharacterized protein LOC120503071 isoform X2 [Passer montanus]